MSVNGETVKCSDKKPQSPEPSNSRYALLSVLLVGAFFIVSRDFWQAIWSRLFHMMYGNEFMVGAVLSAIVPALMFWLFNSFFMYVDYTGKPDWVRKYKIQPDVNVPCPPDRFWAAVRRALYNLFIVGIPFSFVGCFVMKWRGCSLGEELPNFYWIVPEFAVSVVVQEIGFYYSHRLLHTPFLYKRIHKFHHEWVASISIASVYAHPLEHIFSNLLPLFLGPLICGSHIIVYLIWISFGLFNTTVGHSDYHLPFLHSGEFHDFHHAKFTGNFGTIGLLDRLHGTDEAFRKSKAFQRNFRNLSLVPMRVLIPDD